MPQFLMGVAVWGSLLLIVFAWMTRRGGRERRTASAWTHDQQPPRHPTPLPRQVSTTTSPASDAPVRPVATDGQRLRETDALVDGLVIGHFLTRDHYRDRVEALEGELGEIRSAQEPWVDDWSDPASDDPLDDLDRELDHAEFDAMAGFGDEPWADDLFGFDAGDEDEG